MKAESKLMIRTRRPGLRNEYQFHQSLRVKASPSLAETFPDLKSMTLHLEFYESERRELVRQIKYTVNLENAKSVFRITCQNPECIGGDYDLSDAVAEAVAARRKHVSGKLCCNGWRNRRSLHSIACGKILRYRITLGY